MEKVFIKKPTLLLNSLQKEDDFIKKIVKSNYNLLDENLALARYRGNVINRNFEDDTIEVVAWQRNILRVRNGYSSAPCIVKLMLDAVTGKIIDVIVDDSFRGSKGIICSCNYFNKILKKLIGLKIDNLFLSKTKTSDTHCFHITEVLRGAFTAYKLYLNSDSKENSELFYEEENLNSYVDGNMLYLSGLQSYNNEKIIEYALGFENIFDKVSFDENGIMHVFDGINVNFIINDEVVNKKTVNINPKDSSYPNYNEFIVECMPLFEKLIDPSRRIKVFNTNMYIFALIGLLTQAVAVKLFGCNYDYVYHIINGIQRVNNVPLCVGGLLGQEEADRYFPEFKFSEIF